MSEELTTVRDTHRFDEAALAAYLSTHLPGFAGGLQVKQFEGGQSNPTYLLMTPARNYVLRKKPPGKLLPSAHMVEREYRVIKALQDSAVPVPRAYLLCEDSSVIGTAFFVMEYVQSRLLKDPRLPDVDPDKRHAIYDAMIRTLAALHTVDPGQVGLTDFGKHGGYIARQTKRWSEQYRSSQTQEIESMNRLMQWLPEHIPADDATTTALVHGDYRLDNMLYHPDRPEVLAVLDWELSTLGHPLSDLAYCCLNYRVQMAGSYLGDVAGKEGIPSEQELVEMYCRYCGRDSIPDWNFYVVFSLFRYAAIVQGVHYRGLQGNAASERALRYGDLVRTVGDKAWNMVQGLLR
jgi:aminoglycoside phosphotransferase (APT) family kinase protein